MHCVCIQFFRQRTSEQTHSLKILPSFSQENVQRRRVRERTRLRGGCLLRVAIYIFVVFGKMGSSNDSAALCVMYVCSCLVFTVRSSSHTTFMCEGFVACCVCMSIFHLPLVGVEFYRLPSDVVTFLRRCMCPRRMGNRQFGRCVARGRLTNVISLSLSL